MTREEIIQSIPVEPTPTIPTRQPFLPDPDDLIGVPALSFDVIHRIVIHLAVIALLAPFLINVVISLLGGISVWRNLPKLN
jgi:hypothetical protein